jgi:hypothetical protein
MKILKKIIAFIILSPVLLPIAVIFIPVYIVCWSIHQVGGDD